MATRIKVATRAAESIEGSTAEPSPVSQALGDARSVLPWRDLGKPARDRFVLYLCLAPIAVLIARAIALGNDIASFAPLAALGLGLEAGLPAFLTFLGSLAFHATHRDAQSRLRQALVCPFCRDAVDREGTVICARARCGALYHRECWDECAKHYGGCAVFGCSAKKCREVTAAGYVLRLARLALAAVLFPPRAVRALRSNEAESAASVYRRAAEASRGIYRATNANSSRQGWIVLGLGVPLSYAVLGLVFGLPRHGTNAEVLRAFAVLLGVPFLLLVLPYLLAVPVVFTFFFAKAVKRALESEFAALERADQGGGTVLGRLRLGLGGKKDCC